VVRARCESLCESDDKSTNHYHLGKRSDSLVVGSIYSREVHGILGRREKLGLVDALAVGRLATKIHCRIQGID
jgi:hypothetical protein